MAESLFLRLLPYDDKAATLTEAVVAIREGRTLNPVVHTVDPTSFRQVPGSPFAYWVSERIRRLFPELPPFESSGRHACVTNPAGDDQRYFRCWWEVPSYLIDRHIRWASLCKGGEFSRFYSDVHLVVDWDEREGTDLGFQGTLHRPLKRPASADYFFSPGLTYSSRTQLAFSARVLPSETIFHAKGPGVFVVEEERYAMLGLMNSRVFQNLLQLQMTFGSYEVGVIQRTPISDLSRPLGVRLGKLALFCVNLKRDLDRANETSHVFHLPTLLQVTGDTLAERLAAWQTRVAETEQRLAEHQSEIDDIAFRLYGIEGEERRAIEEVVSGQLLVVSEEENEADRAEEEIETETIANAKSLVVDLLSYTLGCTFGRWDIRFATGELPLPELPDPFAPLPAYSPGMLVPTLVTGHYPLTTDLDGILVDDSDHPDDIIRRVREVLEVIWQERAEAIEHEVCEILDIKDLRDYFRKPGNGGFWMDHVRRYSKSRRKAPIYWLLQSSKKNYALWIYYHRLDKDILFKVLLNYVEPKLSLVLNQLSFVRNQVQQAKDQGQGTKDIRKLENDAERLESFVSELRDFEDKLRRAANLHLEPDLNDGVVLNIAPLYELVPWKEAKNYWEELLAGKYEWSSISKQLREKGLVQ